jgi:hypothetical protein
METGDNVAIAEAGLRETEFLGDRSTERTFVPLPIQRHRVCRTG